MKIQKIFHAVLLVTIFLSGCLAPTLPPDKSSGMFDFNPQKLKSSDFAPEIANLIGISQDMSTKDLEKAEAHRRLAILFLQPGNPDRNLRRAVDELGKFLELAPDKLDRAAAVSWAAALTSGAEYQDMKEQNRTLKKQVATLAAKNQELTKDSKGLATANTELLKTIEKLKNLDLSLEKKRRDFR